MVMLTHTPHYMIMGLFLWKSKCMKMFCINLFIPCSCLENPRDGGAWWAAVYGVAQSRTRLKWLSSSSIYSIYDHFWCDRSQGLTTNNQILSFTLLCQEVLFQLFIIVIAHQLLIVDIHGRNDSAVSSICSEIWVNIRVRCFNCNQENEGHFANECIKWELLIFWCPTYKENSAGYLIALWLYTHDINRNMKN